VWQLRTVVVVQGTKEVDRVRGRHEVMRTIHLHVARPPQRTVRMMFMDPEDLAQLLVRLVEAIENIRDDIEAIKEMQ
jgi:hypothetical protein